MPPPSPAGNSPMAFMSLSSLHSIISCGCQTWRIWQFCRIGKITISTVWDVSWTCLGKFTLNILYSFLVALLLNFSLFSFHFCLLIFINTSFHTFSSGLWASFPGKLAIPPFRSLWRSLPFYDLLRYKPNLFFSSGVHGQRLPLCLKWGLGLKARLLLLFTNVQLVHLHELSFCAKFCKKQLSVCLFACLFFE